MKKTNTRKKIDEADFFLEKLIKSAIPDSEYYLSALISSCRSVTYLMEKEYAAAVGFKGWWGIYDKRPLQKFNDLRVVSIHQNYPSMEHRISTGFGSGLTIRAGETAEIPINLTNVHSVPVQINITAADGKKRAVAAHQTRDFIIHAYYEREEREIKFDSFLNDMTDCLDKLKRLVDECESKFS